MEKITKYLIYQNDFFYYALDLNYVVRVIPSVYITPLADTTDNIAGVINVQGQVIPVVNMRKVFSLGEHEQDINDMIIITQTAKDTYGLLVDSVKGVADILVEEAEAGDDVLHSLDKVECVSKLDDELLFIINPDKLLSRDEMVFQKNSNEEEKNEE